MNTTKRPKAAECCGVPLERKAVITKRANRAALVYRCYQCGRKRYSRTAHDLQTARNILHLHRHKCDECGNIWEHDDSCGGDDNAHKCPRCQKEQFVRYWGDQEQREPIRLCSASPRTSQMNLEGFIRSFLSNF